MASELKKRSKMYDDELLRIYEIINGEFLKKAGFIFLCIPLKFIIAYAKIPTLKITVGF